ncbi:MAG: SdrD B-like domain-containing protein, partial [Bacteroidota bacterium]
NPVQLNILESGDGVDFTANTTAEIAVKDFVVSQNFSASRDLRYLKIEKPVGSGFAEIDAISYCKAECPVCDNLTDGGQITGTESNCGSFDPGIIGSVSLPSGGSGIIEYLWLGTTDASLPATQWDTLLVGPSAGPTFDPGLITQTTYYLRCSRREFCELYVGESNIISKVVIDATLPCPSGAAAPCVLGNAVEVVEDDGVFTSRRIVGPINGSLAELYEDTDFVILDLGTTLRPGETYVISWKGTLLDTTANPAKIEISESMNTVDFTAVGSLETRVKDFVISQSRTATVPTRFLRIDKADGLGLVEIDAISYAQLDCPPCDNLTDGGKITGTESNCDSFDPSTINSISLPSGGSGNIEYLWLGTTDASLPATQWDTLLVGPSAGPTFDPGPITQTTYYLRCSRRENCELFVGESNIIAKVVVDASLPCAGGIKTPCVLGNAVEVVEDKGVFTGHRTVGPINGSLAELYEDTDYIVLDLGVTLQAGETYVISWKGTLLDISADPAKIEISEAVDTANFTAVGSLETFVKDFVVSQSVRASGPVRFLRIDKADGFGLVEIDAVTYGQSSCTLPTICELNDHGKADRFNADRTVWLRFAANDEIREYTVAGSGAKLTEFPNGTALLTGIAADVEIPCNQWLFSVKLINKRDWMSWSALGRSYKANNRIANDNHEDWFYYELDDNNSTFTGLDCNEGRVLNLTHMPSDFEFGFQVGDGANLKNENYGISGWFEFTGDFSGRGDFNGNLDNCVEQETAVHIGDFVWEDLNGNGQQDSDEPGIESVKVQLIGTDFCGNGVNMTQFTDANGSYLFSNLTPGTYKTIFSQLPGAYFTTKEKEGTDPSIDSDVNPISGMSDLRVYGGGEKDTTLDAGYIRFASVGDFVWEDLNGDGIKDFNEPGIPNVTVELSGEDGTGEMVSQIKQTNAQGLYYFDGLRPGTYKLSFSPGGTFQATTKGAGTDDTVDSDINPDGMTDLFTLISHETNSNLDAGYYRLLNISGRVFDDRNDDGLQDAGDLDVADVIIALLRKNAGGTFDPVDNFSTLENGRFAFNGLVPGEYQVRADESSLPIDFIFSKNQDVNGNANDAIDNDADDTGVIENIVLRSGQPDLTTLGIGILFNIILPVELVDFQAKLVNNNQALLTWITESEIDNKHFVIERSIDGQLFETIGVVAGNGTSNHINTYFYKDETPFFGRNYYRLKQVDFDGDYEFSDIRTVVVKGNDLPDAIFYPNPTKDFTTLRVVTPFESQATVEIVNAHGQILRTLIVPQGSNSLDIDMSDLQPGFYFMQVKYNEFRKIIHRVLKIQD